MNVELFQLLRGYLRQVGWLAVPIGATLLVYLVCISVPIHHPPRWYLVGGVFLGILLICGIVFLVKYIRKRRRGASLEDALGQGPDGSVAQQGEINALRKQWRDSLATLKGSGVGGGGKGALAALPWFVIIGEPASGKSTLLRQSGIDFPVGDAAIRGLQGTRNCDWWFSNIGVFLDTAGRYVSDASAGEWASFLELVRKHRTGAPINGVIVAIPAPDLVSKTLDQLDYQARQIRARLDELIDHLGVNFPVWVTLTKVDLIAGFAEFFGQADAQTRRQMMGWTLDQAHGMRFDRAVFDRYYQSTVHRLREIRPILIQKAKLRDRPAAFAFPDELGAMGDALGSMLSKMFEPNVYQDTPFFRGLYVTSATQQGTPLQRAAQHIREMLGAPGAPADPHQAIIKHAYFVKDFMNERVVSDREMTWTTKREIERNKTRRLGQNLAGASLGVLIAFAVLANGFRARRELNVVGAEVKAAAPGAGAVERTDALWVAAATASDDNYKNFALSRQRTLKDELQKRQFDLYVKDVLEPLVRGYEEEVDAITIDTGLQSLRVRWNEFRHIRSALLRADTAFAPPPESEADEGEVPPVPWILDKNAAYAPEGFFTTEEYDAFIARGAWLKANGVVGSLKENLFPDVLLVALWRNGTNPLRERIDAIEKSYLRKVYEYLRRAEAEVVDIDAWRDGFRQACEQALLVLDKPRVEQDELRGALEVMYQRASGPPPKEDEGGGGDAERERVDPNWRSTIFDDLTALREDELQLGELATRFPGLADWISGKAASGGGPETALTTIAAAMRDLRTAADGPGGLAAGEWPKGGETIGNVLMDVEDRVQSRATGWSDKAAPHLAELAGMDLPVYRDDPTRWGRAAELIEPGMRRNALLLAFLDLDVDNAFPSLAEKIVESRKSKSADDPDAFDSKTLAEALRELAKVPAHMREVSSTPQVAGSIQERAAKEVEARFTELVTAAQAHWDQQCRELPPYTGDAPAYLAEWVDPAGGVVGLAKRLEKIYADSKSWRIPDELRDEPSAKAAWDRTVALRTRYSFFWTDLGKLQKELTRQLELRSVQLIAGAAATGLKKLDAELPGGGGPKPFQAASWLAGDANGLIDDRARKDLDRASGEVLYGVLADAAEYFNATWGYRVDDVRGALASESRPEKVRAGRELNDFVKELAILFGQGLRYNRGGLAVVPGVQGGVTEAGRRLGATKVEASVRVTFDCLRVPTGKGAESHPFVVLEYRTKSGGQTKSEPWLPNTQQPWDAIVWKEGEDDGFTIYMVPERGPGRKVFRKWSGKDALRRAISDGGGGPELVWGGEGEYDGSEARFSLSYSDSQMFRVLMGGGSVGGNTGPLTLPQTCVRLAR